LILAPGIVPPSEPVTFPVTRLSCANVRIVLRRNTPNKSILFRGE
jgi:hypothetical protein